MDPIAVAAASGIRTRIQALDLLANNIANASTAGFKADHEFHDIFEGESIESGDTGQRLASSTRTWTDFSQGTLLSTGNPLHAALTGQGFFAVQSPSGTYYTRNGAFQLSAAGELQTADGYFVRATGGASIRANGAAPVEIARDGRVLQSGTVLGQLEIVQFASPDDLVKQGSSYYRLAKPETKPRESTAGVAPAHLEGSNVNVAEATVRMVNVMRHYDSLQKAVSMAADMNRKSVEEVARLGS